MNVALRATLNSTVKMLNHAHEMLENIPKMAKDEAEKAMIVATDLVLYGAARVENILAHLDQNVDVEHEIQEEQEHEALFRSEGF